MKILSISVLDLILVGCKIKGVKKCDVTLVKTLVKTLVTLVTLVKKLVKLVKN